MAVRLPDLDLDPDRATHAGRYPGFERKPAHQIGGVSQRFPDGLDRRRNFDLCLDCAASCFFGEIRVSTVEKLKAPAARRFLVVITGNQHPEGRIVYTSFGEGDYDRTEARIRQLLDK